MMLPISLVAIAFFVGLLFGAGLVLAGMKPERALTVQAMDKLAVAHIQVQALIDATQELAKLNAQMVTTQSREQIPVLVTVRPDGKVN